MSAQAPERRLAAILFTDLVDSTALMARSEEEGLRAKRRHRELVQGQVASYRGEFIEAPGDETLSIFGNALDAVNCALGIEAAAEGEVFKLHIAIHSGDVLVDGNEVHGDGVNIAARLLPLSQGGGICVSGEVYRAIRNHPEIEATSRGEQDLKNVGQPVTVYSIARRAAAGAAPELAARDTGRPTSSARTIVLGAIAVSVVPIAALAAWFWTREPPPLEPIRSIAVLPLENLSGDPEQEYFADGLTEELTNALVKVPGLRVAARTSAFTFKGRREDVRTIGGELDVDGVLEGSVRRSGNQLRVTVQLVRAADGFHVWSNSYDRQLEDVFAIQSEIAAAVVATLRIELHGAMTPGTLVEPPTADLEAYNDYLQGRHHLYAYTSADTRRAIQYFERALARDPNFALAHTGLANSYTYWQGFGLFSAQESRTRAWAAASRALETDPELAEAHAAMGVVQLIHEWDPAAAERSHLRGIELKPRLTDPHLGYWLILQLTGRHDEALVEMERLLQLDPLSPMVQTNSAAGLYFVRRFDEAASALTQVLESQPTYQFARHMLAKVYTQQQRYDEAIAELEKLLAQRGAPARYGGAFTQPPEGQLGYIYAMTGQHGDARALLKELQGRSIPGSQWQIGVALIHMGLGDTERVFEWLEHALQGHVTDQWMKVDPLYDPLRLNPRFDDLLRRIGFLES